MYYLRYIWQFHNSRIGTEFGIGKNVRNPKIRKPGIAVTSFKNDENRA